MTFAIASLCLASAPDAPHARAELVSVTSSVPAGRPIDVAVVIHTDPGWHVYWTNPGDSGIATTVKWKLPPGWKASDLLWPTPHRFESNGIVNYGYEGEVLLLARLTPPAESTPAVAKIGAHVDWLVCQEACVPGSADLTLPLAVNGASRPHPLWAPKIAQARQARQRTATGWVASATRTKDGFRLKVRPPAGTQPPKGTPTFLASDPNVLEPSAPEKVRWENGIYTLDLRASQYAEGKPSALRGLFIAPKGTTWAEGVDALELGPTIR